MSTPSNQHSRIPSLDGLRAISILFVLLGHLSGSHGFADVHWLERLLGNYAELGVRVFFVISGFLITSLLIDEEKKTGTVSLKQFYFRRTMRIFPAFYAFIAAMALADWLGFISLRENDVLAALTYTTNYHRDRAWQLGHTWSLSVEEQFYLLWPFVVRAFGTRRAMWVAAAMLVVAPLCRVGTKYLFSSTLGVGETFQTVADSIAVGCLLAGWGPSLRALPSYQKLQRSPWFWLMPFVVIASNVNPIFTVRWLVGETIMNFGIALIIDRVVNREGAVQRFLNLRPLVFVGTLSYSLYLWQQPFLNRNSDAWSSHFPFSLLLTIGAAAISFFLIERPCLKLRQRMEKRWWPQPTSS